MPLPDAAVAQYLLMQRLQVATMAGARAAWARMGENFDSSWGSTSGGIGRDLAVLLSAAQLAAATAAAGYVPDVLAEQGIAARADGSVRASALSGVASDGRSLAGLLYGAVTTAKVAVGQGSAPLAALAVGGRWLDMVTRTQVVDAARTATSVQIAARPGVGWTRMVNPPCCGRCAILAGRFYRWSSGFQRHPRCDCINVPCSEDTAGDARTSSERLFSEGHVRGLSAADAAAISDGSDPAQVVNAHRGMATAQVYGHALTVTTEGTTRRGAALKAMRANRAASDINGLGGSRAPRLMPESIYKIAADRADALRLLRLNGYLT